MQLETGQISRLTREYTHHQKAADNAAVELQAYLIAWLDGHADPARAWDWLQSQPFALIGYQFPTVVLDACRAWLQRTH